MASRAWIYTAVYVGSILAASLYYQHHEKVAVKEAVTVAVQHNTDMLVAQYTKKLAEADAKFKQQTADMQEAANKQKVSKDEQLKAVDTKLAAALVELRNRPSRSDPPSTTQIANDPVRGAACTGAELYREDGEFLKREAARAESVLIERNYYYSRYITVQEQMNRANQ